MDLYPAIDLRAGRCVRLYQGDFGRETVYGDDPVGQARLFADAGAQWIHVVDLDAARSGNLENRDSIAAIAAAVDIPVQAGGGIRNDAAARSLFEAGVARVVIGTAALEDVTFVRRLAADHPVAVGLDGRGGNVAVRGWQEDSERTVLDVAAELADDGLAALIITEIAVDGTLDGPDVAGLRRILAASDIDIIASGGVGTIGDLEELAALEVRGRRLAGAITGRALYEDAFTIEEALTAAAS